MFQKIILMLAAVLTVASIAQADIQVTGQGSVGVPPDMATISVGVVTSDLNVKDALKENNAKVRAVFDTLLGNGVEEKCFETSQFTIQPKYDYRTGQEPRLVGYVVLNQIVAKVYDLDKLGDILAAVTESGVNRVGAIEFGVRKMEDALKVARQRATEDALARAKLYCESLDLKVGQVLSITENEVRQPVYARYDIKEVAEASRSVVPISSGGDKVISVSVSVRFKIDHENNRSDTLR